MRIFCTALNINEVTPPVSTYETEADDLFARFTNTYGAAEKDLINNLIIDLKTNGIWDKLDHFYMGALSGEEEQLLDWKDANYDLIEVVGKGSTVQVPYKGIAGQTGCFTNSAPPDSGNLTQDDAFISFKLLKDYKVPFANAFFGCDDSQFPQFTSAFVINGSIIEARVNINGNTGFSAQMLDGGNKIPINKTVVGVRNGSASGFISCINKVIGTGTSVSTGIPIYDVYVGDRNRAGANYIPNTNFIQHIAYGQALTEAQSNALTVLIDDFCDAQLALDTEYIQQTGFKVYLEDKDFLDRLGNQCVWQDADTLYYSIDGGLTVSSSIAFSMATFGFGHMCHIFDDGKIIIATNANKIYKTTTALSSLTEMTPTKNGVTYTLHTPVNPANPGEYYKFLGTKQKQYLTDGTEIFVWGNYGTSLDGATPSLVWYSFGDEVKVAYEFGQNPYITDNGNGNGGTGGTLLGDATENNYARHTHGCFQRPDDKSKFILFTGDLDRVALSPVLTDFYESKMMELVYDDIADTWSNSILKEDSAYTKTKATFAGMPDDGFLYYASDAIITTGNELERGWFKSTYANISDPTLHTRIYEGLNPTRPRNMAHYDGSFWMGGGYAAYSSGSGFAGFFGAANIIYSEDLINFTEVDLKIPSNLYNYKITKISTKKYMLNFMPDYFYHKGSISVILDFN